jgi:glycosyltransferase involved in cell wall biosynthesis
MDKWYMNHTGRGMASFGALDGLWVSNRNTFGIDPTKFKRIWPYHLAQKPFYHLASLDLEERARWANLPFYDAWIRLQTLPISTNVVHGPMGSCKSLFGLAGRSGRKILKVYDSPNSHPQSLKRIWQGGCDRFLPGYRIPIPDRALARMEEEISLADMVLCPSIFVKDSMVEAGVPEAKCFVNHFGVDTTVFRKRERIPDRPRFVCVGSITLRKGHQYLFKAFEMVRRKLPDAELIIIGSHRPDFDLEWPKWRDGITHHPALPHPAINEIFQSSTAFVFPSLEEGFARVLSEAMGAGLPVIATRESGATTVIQDGVHGFIIPPANPERLAERMIEIASNPMLNQALGHAAWVAGAECNTWADYAGRLYAEYQRRLS